MKRVWFMHDVADRLERNAIPVLKKPHQIHYDNNTVGIYMHMCFVHFVINISIDYKCKS